MKAISTLNWGKIRDWLAEAGSACSGFYPEYQESRVSRAKLLPHRPFDEPGHATKGGLTTRSVASSRNG